MSLYVITLFLCLLANHGFAQQSQTLPNGTEGVENTTDVRACTCYINYATVSPLEAGQTFFRDCTIPRGWWANFDVNLRLKENRIADTWEVTVGCDYGYIIDQWRGRKDSVLYVNRDLAPPPNMKNFGVCRVIVKNTNWFMSQQYIGAHCITRYQKTIDDENDRNYTIPIIDIPRSETKSVPWIAIYVVVGSVIVIIVIGIITILVYRRKKRLSYNNIA